MGASGREGEKAPATALVGGKGPCNSPCRGPKGGRGMEGEKAPAIALLGGQRVEEEGREKRPLNENKPLSLCDRCYGCEAHL